MNWGLILRLSLFGLVMAFGSVWFVPANVEPILWLGIFIGCAFWIARGAPRLPFVHGLLVGIVNSVYITTVHVVFMDAYLAHHPREAAMMKTMTLPIPPRLLMACIGPLAGVASGIVIGLFALLAGLIVRRRRSKAAEAGRTA